MIQIVHRDDIKALSNIAYFEVPPLKSLGFVNHAFCARSTRVSHGTHSSPESGAGRGEKQARILSDKELVARAFGFEPQQLITMDQVHGDRIWVIHKRAPLSQHSLNCRSDALLTDQHDIAIGVLTADCVPILLVDPSRKVIGIIHAGWRGTLLGIARKVLHTMIDHFGTHPEDLFVAIGPSIGECCYEVDEAVMDPLRSSGWNWQSFSRPRGNGKWHLNLARANIEQMRENGIREDKCFWVRVCTRCNNDILFSYRAEGPGTGEQISFIQMRG
jgi:YfiH family protein